MAARTIDTDVIAILGKHYDSVDEPSLTPFIDTATLLVDWLAGQDTDSELSAAVLKRIEAYLTAHFYAHSDQISQSKGVGRANASYQGQTAMALNGSQYGQTACLLDVTGNLAARSRQAEVGVTIELTGTWLGKPPSEQTDYEDRD